MSSRPALPDLRHALTIAARCLGDSDFQARCWDEHRRPAHDLPTFEQAVSSVLDELAFAERAALVGEVLLDARELSRFTGLVEQLTAVMARIGPRGSFREASETPEWRSVQFAAVRLVGVLSVGDIRTIQLPVIPVLAEG